MRRARSFSVCAEMVSGATGLEFGGPSPIFSRGGLLPVYPLAGRIDNCNFARSTIWEAAIVPGESFVFHQGRDSGSRFTAEAADLRMAPNDSYDFVLRRICLNKRPTR